MLSSLTLQIPMNVASKATEIATKVFKWALDFFASATAAASFFSPSSSTNCIGSGSISAHLLQHENQSAKALDTLSFSEYQPDTGREQFVLKTACRLLPNAHRSLLTAHCLLPERTRVYLRQERRLV